MNPKPYQQKPYSLSVSTIESQSGFTGVVGTAKVSDGVKLKTGIGPVKSAKTWRVPTINPKQSLEFISKTIEMEAEKWFQSIKEESNELAPNKET